MEEGTLNKENVEKAPEEETVDGCVLMLSGWDMKMKIRKNLPDGNKNLGETSLAPLNLGTVSKCSWDEVINGFAQNNFQVSLSE